MVCHGKNHDVGGTEKGRKFLSGNPHLPGSFLTSVKPGVITYVYVHTYMYTLGQVSNTHLCEKLLVSCTC